MQNTKILIVVDVQNDFVTGNLGSTEARNTIPAIAQKIQNCIADGYAIVVTKDTHDSENYLDTNEGRHLPVPHTIKNSWGWDIYPTIESILSQTEVTTLEKESFGATGLPHTIMQTLFIKGEDIPDSGKGMHIELVGFCTDICVISNALILKAVYPEADITVDAGCCAGVTPDLHRAALTVMKSCQIDIIGEEEKI